MKTGSDKIIICYYYILDKKQYCKKKEKMLDILQNLNILKTIQILITLYFNDGRWLRMEMIES
jgi:hypothetical protein